jgi:3-hydroxyisobutyryl-CoA hydrolase
MQSGASNDFNSGITAVLIEKTTGRPAWSPANLNDVSDAVVGQFFEQDSSFLGAMPTLTSPDFISDAKHNPMKFALPSEDTIRRVVKFAKDPITLSDLLAHFDDLTSGKQGVEEKVLAVVRRKCDVTGSQGSEVVNWKE